MTHLKWKRSLALLASLLVLLVCAVQAAASPAAQGVFKSDFESFVSGPALSGRFEIVEEKGRTYLQFDASFKAKNAPDLKVFLSARASEEITGQNAIQDAVRLGRLKEFAGEQRYLVPQGLDLSQFSTVIVHCEQYSKLWGTGRLGFSS